MNEVQLLKILQTEVTTAVDGKYPVKYMNVNLKTPKDGKWWEILYIPANTTDEFWGEGQTLSGVLRLLLHWPQDNKGVYKPMEEAMRVKEYFNKGKKVFLGETNEYLTFTSIPDVTGYIEEAPESIIPLTIKYNAFTM